MRDYLKKISEEMSESQDLIFNGVDSSRRIRKPEDLKPGDLVSFSYKGSDYSIIITATKRTGRGSGFYIAQNTNNELVTSIKINFGLQIHTLFLSNIYGKEKKANYEKLSKKNSPWLRRWFTFSKKSRKQSILNGLMGRNNFRTFIFSEMKQIIILDVGV